MGGACFDKKPHNLYHLKKDYALCAAAEGNSPKSIDIVLSSVTYLENFLVDFGASTEVRHITAREIRAFILYLRQKPCFAGHPTTPAQARGLSGHTINTYLRSIRAFFSWLVAEGFLEASPFDRVKVPRAPKKVIPTFSEEQIQQLLAVIDTGSPQGYRDYAIILTLLDTGLRVSELIGLQLPHVSLAETQFKVWGKGNKERVVPVGSRVCQHLVRYISRYRPQPASLKMDRLFLSWDGYPLTKDRIERILRDYGNKADIQGVRCSPHTLRHTAAVIYLRQGGDPFTLQKLLGHSTLDMTRRYCELADLDLKRVHQMASPVDNIDLMPPTRSYRRSNGRTGTPSV